MGANDKQEVTALTVVERAAVALGAAEHERKLVELSTKYADITAIANNAGREQVHSAYMELKNTRISIESAGEGARDDANKFQKAVIAEVKRLTAITAAEEVRLKVLRDDYDAEKEREKAAKAEAERQRVAAIRAKIDEIKTCPTACVGRSSIEIQDAIENLTEHEITLEEFQEFSGEASQAKDVALGKMQDALAAQKAHEAEAARIAAEREALAKERETAAERERVAAAARAEEDRKARAELDRLRAEQAERDRIAAEARAAEEAKLQAARDAEEARLKAIRDAEEAKLAEQRAEIARQQAAIDAERQRQADEAARIESEKQAAIDAENARIAAEEQRQREEAEAAERAEAQRAAEALAAHEAEQRRRALQDFINNGPEPTEIIEVLASHYGIDDRQIVLNWMSLHVWSAVEIES